MRIAECELISADGSPYSQSKYIETERGEKQTAEDHEAKCWRERMHVDESGHVFIPPMAFKNCLSEIAKYLARQIPGKGKTTYTKHFEAGVMCVDPLVLETKADDVIGEWLFVPSDGKRGGGRRVMRRFPKIPKWSGKVTFYVLDDVITKEVFEAHLREAGSFIGIGRFRPRSNGYYGRFIVKSVTWKEM